ELRMKNRLNHGYHVRTHILGVPGMPGPTAGFGPRRVPALVVAGAISKGSLAPPPGGRCGAELVDSPAVPLGGALGFGFTLLQLEMIMAVSSFWTSASVA